MYDDLRRGVYRLWGTLGFGSFRTCMVGMVLVVLIRDCKRGDQSNIAGKKHAHRYS